MSFVFTRVDDRAIHGQTVTMWSKIFQNNGILLVDDEISTIPPCVRFIRMRQWV